MSVLLEILQEEIKKESPKNLYLDSSTFDDLLDELETIMDMKINRNSDEIIYRGVSVIKISFN